MVNALTEPPGPHQEKYTIDHVRPVARRGTNWAWNLVLACRHCNGSHGPRMVFSEWQPSNMLPWMRGYLLRAMILDVIWQIWFLRLWLQQW